MRPLTLADTNTRIHICGCARAFGVTPNAVHARVHVRVGFALCFGQYIYILGFYARAATDDERGLHNICQLRQNCRPVNHCTACATTLGRHRRLYVMPCMHIAKRFGEPRHLALFMIDLKVARARAHSQMVSNLE